jgi:hypothetical protein
VSEDPLTRMRAMSEAEWAAHFDGRIRPVLEACAAELRARRVAPLALAGVKVADAVPTVVSLGVCVDDALDAMRAVLEAEGPRSTTSVGVRVSPGPARLRLLVSLKADGTCRLSPVGREAVPAVGSAYGRYRRLSKALKAADVEANTVIVHDEAADEYRRACPPCGAPGCGCHGDVLLDAHAVALRRPLDIAAVRHNRPHVPLLRFVYEMAETLEVARLDRLDRRAATN